MNIGVDARVLEKKTTGIGRILTGIIENVYKIDNTIHFTLFSNTPIVKEYENCTNVFTNTSSFLSKPIAPFWLDYVLPRVLKKHKIDLFFGPNFYLPTIRNKNSIKSIVVIHDVIHKIFPDYQPNLYRKYLDLSVKRSIGLSEMVLADSECTKRDITRYYGVKSEKIKVVYPFVSEAFAQRDLDLSVSERIRSQYGLPKEFILYVGVIEKRKNIESFADISRELKKRNISLPIILVGRKGYRWESIFNSIRTDKEIRFLDFVDEKDLPYLYNLAKIFVFPSFYEGFGFPPLEAMKSGLPIVTSNGGSLPEVVGDAMPVFHPQDVLGMVNEIAKLLSDHSYYQKCKENCIIQANKFSREYSLNKMVDVFQTAVRKQI